MAVNKKLVTILVLCMVVLSALVVPKVEADDYKQCNEKCQSECKNEGTDGTMCAMKCETKCGANVVKGIFLI